MRWQPYISVISKQYSSISQLTGAIELQRGRSKSFFRFCPQFKKTPRLNKTNNANIFRLFHRHFTQISFSFRHVPLPNIFSLVHACIRQQSFSPLTSISMHMMRIDLSSSSLSGWSVEFSCFSFVCNDEKGDERFIRILLSPFLKCTCLRLIKRRNSIADILSVPLLARGQFPDWAKLIIWVYVILINLSLVLNKRAAETLICETIHRQYTPPIGIPLRLRKQDTRRVFNLVWQLVEYFAHLCDGYSAFYTLNWSRFMYDTLACFRTRWGRYNRFR